MAQTSIANPFVLIATPTATAQVLQCYVQSLFELRKDLADAEIGTAYSSLQFSEVHTARNVLAAQFLAHPKATHLFFVDSDMALPPGICRDLLKLDKDLVGAAYPKRVLDLQKLEASLVATNGNFSDALNLTYEFAVRPLPGAIPTVSGLVQVSGIGMGAALISRNVFETMISRNQVDPIQHNEIISKLKLQNHAHDFFGQLKTENGAVLSEDYAFCERWRYCKGETYAFSNRHVAHVGQMLHSADFAKHLELRTALRSRVIFRAAEHPFLYSQK